MTIKNARFGGYHRHFNSHAHVERDAMTFDEFVKKYNFNSHAHVERDSAVLFPLFFVEISTHTLTWSVTGNISTYTDSGKISTHTLTWSVT